MKTALEVLRELFQIGNLGDHVYRIRECEGLGWDGPKVIAWSNACTHAQQLLNNSDEEFDCRRVLQENGAIMTYTDRIQDSTGRVFNDPFPGYTLTWKGESVSLSGLNTQHAHMVAGIYVYLRLRGVPAAFARELAIPYVLLLSEEKT